MAAKNIKIWIARDANDELWAYWRKPYNDNGVFKLYPDEDDYHYSEPINDLLYDWIEPGECYEFTLTRELSKLVECKTIKR